MNNTYRNKTFTLVELIITISLVAVVGLAVYSTFSSGLKVWRKVNVPYLEEDLSIFFDKISTDLRSSLSYKGINFEGTDTRLEFATLVSTQSKRPGLKFGPGQVSYYLDQDKGVLYRQKRNLSNVYTSKGSLTDQALSNVRDFKLKYYSFDSLRGGYFWSDEWKEEYLPLAVSLSLEIGQGKQTYKVKRTINLPLAYEKI